MIDGLTDYSCVGDGLKGGILWLKLDNFTNSEAYYFVCINALIIWGEKNSQPTIKSPAETTKLNSYAVKAMWTGKYVFSNQKVYQPKWCD